METTEHYGTIRLAHIEDAVRKPTHEGAANTSVYLRVGLRVLVHRFDDCLEGVKKICPEIGAPRAVSSVGLREVGLRLQREPNGHSLLVRRDRMEDQGSAEVGSSE